MHNIDKSKSRPGEYVGYAKGSWRIKRNSRGWEAKAWTAMLGADDPAMVFGRTLKDISGALEAIVTRDTQRKRASVLVNPFVVA